MDRDSTARKRPRPRARRDVGLVALWAAAAIAAGASSLRADDPDGPGALPWSVHERVGFTVDAASFPDSAGLTLEVYVRIPPPTLAALRRDTGGAAKLRVAVRLSGRPVPKPIQASEDFTLAAGDTFPGFGKVLVMRFPVRPGSGRLKVKVEDLLSHKRGLGYVGRGVTESASIEGEVTVPGSQAGRQISDVEFLWSLPGDQGAGLRGNALPNPERLYGLLASELRAQFCARGLPGDARAWHWHARVIDAEGRVLAEQESTEAAGAAVMARMAVDVSRLPAGGYDLELKVWMEGDAGALMRTAGFSIGWEPGTWLVDPVNAQDVVHFLLSASDEHKFARLQPGEREEFLDRYWRERDPTPETAENEAKRAFFERVDYANRNFGGLGVGRGMFSDMGRVYIRYGEPGEILKQVIPAGDETLASMIQTLELSEDRSTGNVHQKGLGGDTRPYEVWIYQGDIGTPPDADPSVAARSRPRRRMVFLFVDENGYGLYALRYSTE